MSEFDRRWYDFVENEVTEMFETTKRLMTEEESSGNENFENGGIQEGEIKKVISTTRALHLHLKRRFLLL